MSLILAILFAFAPLLQSPALPGPGNGGGGWVTDNFTSSGDLNNYASQLNALPNDWSIANNTLSNSGSVTGQWMSLYVPSLSVANTTVSAKVRMSSTASAFLAISGRVNLSTGARYQVQLEGSGAVALYDHAPWTGGSSTLLGSASWTADTDWHTLTLQMNGASLTVTLDGTQKISTTDSTLTSGSVAMEAYNEGSTTYSFQQFTYIR